MLGTAFNIATSGLATEDLRARVAATNVANASTAGYVPQRVEQETLAGGGVAARVRPLWDGPGAVNTAVDLAHEAVSLQQAKIAYEANIAVFEAVVDMSRSLIDATGHRHCDCD